MSITAQTLRIKVDKSSRRSLTDAATGKPFEMYRGNDTRIELGIFDGEDVVLLDSLASLTFEVDLSQTTTEAPAMKKTVDAADLQILSNADSWNDGTEQHAQIDFTATEANLDLGGLAKKQFWLVIHAMTNEGKLVTLGTGSFIVVEDNAGTAGTPPANDPAYYTKEEADALLGLREAVFKADVDYETAATVDVVIPDPMLVELIHLTSDVVPTDLEYTLGTPADSDAVATTQPAFADGLISYSVNQKITGGVLRLTIGTNSSVPAVGQIIVKGTRL